jgi:hypothetical protein
MAETLSQGKLASELIVICGLVTNEKAQTVFWVRKRLRPDLFQISERE